MPTIHTHSTPSKVRSPETRILVGIVTYDQEEPYLNALLEALQAQTCQDFDLVIVDNSPTERYVQTLNETIPSFFPADRCTVRHLEVTDGRFQRILQSRERVREEFLATGYTHLWWLDSDVLPPPEALKTLLDAKEELVTGIYLVGKEVAGSKAIVPPILLDMGGGTARQATVDDILAVDSLEIGAAGLGCTLATRTVVEAVPFRLNPHGTGEDIMFYRDSVERLGIRPVALCTVRCQHLHFPIGDSRNSPYDFAAYRLE